MITYSLYNLHTVVIASGILIAYSIDYLTELNTAWRWRSLAWYVVKR